MFLGFAAIFDNDDHIVHAKNRGVLRRCDEPRAMAIVVDVANLEGDLPYRYTWTRNGKPISTHTGATGSFDAKPTRVEFSFRKRRPLPESAYVFKLTIEGKVVVTGKVRRACN